MDFQAGSADSSIEYTTLVSMISAGLIDPSTDDRLYHPKRVMWKPVAPMQCMSCHFLTGEMEYLHCIEFDYLTCLGEVDISPPVERWLWTSCEICDNFMGIHIDLTQDEEFLELAGAVFSIDGDLRMFANLPTAPRLPREAPRAGGEDCWGWEHQAAVARQTFDSMSATATDMHGRATNLAMRRGKLPPLPVFIPPVIGDDQAVQGNL